MIENNKNVRNSNDFDLFSQEFKIDDKKFIDKFYENRSNYMKNNFSEWVKLSPLFLHIKKFFHKYDKNNLFISTSNSKITIVKTLAYHEVDFNEQNIFDNTASLEKKEHIIAIKDRKKSSYEDISFIDDQISHFPNLLKLGVKCFLATWGYNNEEQRKEAEKLGVVLVDEDNFYEKLVSS